MAVLFHTLAKIVCVACVECAFELICYNICVEHIVNVIDFRNIATKSLSLLKLFASKQRQG